MPGRRDLFPSYSGGPINPNKVMGFPIADGTQVLKGDGTWGAVPSDPKYTNVFPANPVNGMEFYYVDSVTNPSYLWHLRYNANSTSAFKWEFVGGSSWITTDDADVSTASVFTGNPSLVPLGTLGTYTFLRNGDWEITFGSNYYNTAANVYGYTVLCITGAASYYSYHNQNATANSWVASGERTVKLTGQTIGDVVSVRHAVSGGTGHWGQRGLSIRPVRLQHVASP